MRKMASETIVLGGGCFWCTEAVFELFKGVVKTAVGYSGGTKENPTYEEVCSGATGHIEVLKLDYDPKVMPLDLVFQVFFAMHDPTSMDRQGADFGEQYRSVIFYTTDAQKKAAEAFIKKAQSDYKKPIVTELRKLDKFYEAEDYHQKYFDNNPHAGYCSIVIGPKVAKIKREFSSLLK